MQAPTGAWLRRPNKWTFTHLVGAVEESEHVSLLHGHLARTLLGVVVDGNHTLLPDVVHDWRLLLLQRNKTRNVNVKPIFNGSCMVDILKLQLNVSF